MARFKIGVIVDSFRLPPREGVRKAKEVGADGFQIYAVQGEMAPENMDAAKRQAFRDFVREVGLEISALCGDCGHYGFQHNDAKARDLLEKSKRIVDLAVD
ncbi:MAG: sugar phosphate isomerase/epimerase, partial [Planctomycetota bacterium]|nr:sugar phosphate isomerase/epimerase [Planctomycetota bacterium]